MVPALMFHLTEDFRQKMVRQRVNEQATDNGLKKEKK
jgi:hypothetical protein